MKKFLLFLLALTMVLSVFAGCGKTEKPAQTQGEKAIETPAMIPQYYGWFCHAPGSCFDYLWYFPKMDYRICYVFKCEGIKQTGKDIKHKK